VSAASGHAPVRGARPGAAPSVFESARIGPLQVSSDFARSKGAVLSLAYQPMRNIAAVQAIAGSNRKTGFVLVYDERNPYFTGAERWPGWVAVLEDLSTNAETRFGTLTWQQLLEGASLDTSLVTWAREKHGLEPSPLR